MTHLGIDPGLQGGLAFLKDEGRVVELYRMPLIGSKDYDVQEIKKIITRYPEIFATLEKQQSMPGQGLSSTFKTGMGFGMLIGLVTGLEIPFQIVPPQKWQKSLFTGLPLKQDTKEKSAIIAKRLFPTVDFRKSERSTKPADGLTDAACIAEYGRRTENNTANANEAKCAHVALQENPNVCIKCGDII